MKHLEDSGIGGVLNIGDSDAMVGAPVEEGMAGILVAVGVNLLAAVEEAGIPVTTSPVSTVLEYGDMTKL